jgi:hypothetical protein
MWHTILFIGELILGTIIALITVYFGMLGGVPKKEEELKKIQGHLTPIWLYLLEILFTIWWTLGIWIFGGGMLGTLIENILWSTTPKEKIKNKIEKAQKDKRETDTWWVEQQREERERKRRESMSPEQLMAEINRLENTSIASRNAPSQVNEMDINSASIRNASTEELARMLSALDKRSDREYSSDKASYSNTCSLIKEIGRKLNRDGSEELMKQVLVRAGSLGCNTRFVEREWNGIGTWLG